MYFLDAPEAYMPSVFFYGKVPIAAYHAVLFRRISPPQAYPALVLFLHWWILALLMSFFAVLHTGR